MNVTDYDQSTDKGYIESTISDGDIIIGRVQPIKSTDKGYITESTISDGDIIFGRVQPIQLSENTTNYRDSSEVYKSHAPSIDSVFNKLNEGYEITKCRIRSERIPMIGDIFCGQTANHGTINSQISVESIELP